MKFWFRFCTIIVFFAASAACAQPFGGGIRAGLNASQIAGDGTSGYHKAGFSGATYLYYYTSEKFGLQFELGYSPKGSARRPDPEDPSLPHFVRKLNYVELPMLARSKIGRIEPEAGISFDLLTGASEEINGYTNNSFERSDWKNLTVNGLIGLRYKINRGLVVNIRSTNALHSVRKKNVPGNVRRFGRSYGEYNDVLFFGISYEINSPIKP